MNFGIWIFISGFSFWVFPRGVILYIVPKKLLLILDAILPPLIWASFIFILSSNSVLANLDVSTLDYIFKKSSHMIVYAILFVLVHRAFFLLNSSKLKSFNWFFTFMICLLYAVSDEYHQSLVPGRHPAFRDVGIDMIGSLVAFLRLYQYI